MTNNRNTQSNQVAANHISDNKKTGSNRNSLIKTKWRKPLGLLLSLSILTGMSTGCLANEKHEQTATKKTPLAVTKEDGEGWGLVIASIEAAKLGIDTKDLVFKYNKEDMKLIRKLSDIFDTEAKRKLMARIDRKQKANEALTEEEGLVFEDYDQALAELKKILKQKK